MANFITGLSLSTESSSHYAVAVLIGRHRSAETDQPESDAIQLLSFPIYITAEAANPIPNTITATVGDDVSTSMGA